MATPKGFIGVGPPPTEPTQLPFWLRALWTRFETVQQGKLNAIGSVTLNTSATTTSISDARIGSESFITLMPRTTAAGQSTVQYWVSARSKGAATIAHASTTASLGFDYLVIG